MVNIRNNNKKA